MSLSTRTSLRECERKREAEGRGKGEARKRQEYIPRDLTGWGVGRTGDLRRWDEGQRTPCSPPPRTGRPKKAAVVRDLRSVQLRFTTRPPSIGRVGHGPAAKLTAYPHEGFPARVEWPPLGKGSLLEPRRFSLAQDERHLSSHASHRTTPWICPPNWLSRLHCQSANLEHTERAALATLSPHRPTLSAESAIFLWFLKQGMATLHGRI